MWPPVDWNVPTVSAFVSVAVALVTLAATGYDLSWQMRTVKRLDMQAALLSVLADGEIRKELEAGIREDTAALLARRAHGNRPAYKWLGWWTPIVGIAVWVQYANDDPDVHPNSLIHHPWEWPANVSLVVALLGFLSMRDRLKSRRDATVKRLLDDKPEPTGPAQAWRSEESRTGKPPSQAAAKE
jgi:hypothetical protein